MSRLSPHTLAVAGGLAVVLAACAFNQIYGVAQLEDEVATGIMETAAGGGLVYVGTIEGGTRWDAVTQIQAIDTSTGNVVGSSVTLGNFERFRAVAQNESDDTVWLLRDNGALEHHTSTLSSLSKQPGFFEAPAGTTLERFCDLELIQDSHFVATGVYSDGGDLYGFFEYSYPDPWVIGGQDTQWWDWPLAAGADLDQSCPRVSHENTSGETLILAPNDASSAPAVHRVYRYDSYSWQGIGGITNWGLSYVGDWTQPIDAKMKPGDMTAEFGKVVIAWQHITDLSPGRLSIYEQATGVIDDSVSLERARAVDFSDTPQILGDDSSVLWWGGLEEDTGSAFEVGVYSFVE